MSHRFKNKVALITGAGGGIGLATVEQFAREGAIIVASDIDHKNLENAANIAKEYRTEIHLLPGNLIDPDHCDQLPDRAFNIHNRLDILINNAGLMRRGDILSTSDEDWSLSMTVNVESVFRLCRAAIKRMKQQQYGAIVNVASCWGVYPGPNHLAYCTSKAAVAGMTKCLGRDHAADGIRVNGVCPNEVNTPMLRTGFEIRGLNPDDAIRTLNESVPIGHIAEPAEIADVIAFLASEESRYMCGALVEINGGKPVY